MPAVMNRLNSCHTASITPMLGTRAVYQAWLSGLQLPFAFCFLFVVIFPLLMVAFGILGVVERISKLIANWFPVSIPGPKVVHAFAYLDASVFFLTSDSLLINFAVLVFFVAICVAVVPTVGPLIFAVLKATHDDLVWGIVISLVILIAIVLLPAAPLVFSDHSGTIIEKIGALSVDDFIDASRPSETLRTISCGVAAVFVGLHFVGAVTAKAFRFPRLSAAAPRIGMREVINKYSGQKWSRVWNQVGVIMHGLNGSFVRAIIFAVVVSILLLFYGMLLFSYGFLVIHSSVPDPAFIACLPLLLTFCVGELVALWDLIRQPGWRLMNAVFMIFFLPNIPGAVVIRVAHVESITPTLASEIGVMTILLMAILMRGYLLAPLHSAFLRFRRNLIRTASEIAADAKRKPILLLRTFADDQAQVDRSFRIFAFVMGARSAKTALEEVIAEALFARGPVIALSDPRAKHPAPLGAARDESPDEAWQDYVLRRMDEAQLIVVVLGRTASLAWEVEQLGARGALTRTIFVAPPGYPLDRTLSTISLSVAGAIGLDTQAEIALGQRVRVICYDRRKARWTALTCLFRNERAYVEAVRIGAELAIR